MGIVHAVTVVQWLLGHPRALRPERVLLSSLGCSAQCHCGYELILEIGIRHWCLLRVIRLFTEPEVLAGVVTRTSEAYLFSERQLLLLKSLKD